MSFFRDEVAKALANLQTDGDKYILYKNAKRMENWGIFSKEDFRDAFYILNAEHFVKKAVGKKNVDGILKEIYYNRKTNPIGSILDFRMAIDKAAGIVKTAYPQGAGIEYIAPEYNINKWVETMRQMYILMHKGYSRNIAFDASTKDWDKMEKFDFKNWLGFYEGNGHKSYKTAQNYYQVGNGGYLPLPQQKQNNNLPGPIPDMASVSDDLLKAQEQERMAEIERQRKAAEKESVAYQIKALIGRLNSAEKIATTKGLDKALGPDVYKRWLETLHALKREIQVANVKSAQSRTIQDLLFKNANKLNNRLGAAWIYKIAQMDPTGEMPPEGEPVESGEGVEMPVEEEGEDAMSEFVMNLNGKSKDYDENDSDDIVVEEGEDDGNIIVAEDDNYDIRVYAQEAPGEGLEEVAPVGAPEGEVVPEVEKEPLDAKPPEPLAGELLGNVTIEDAIAKLEGVIQIYQNRELSRQLAIVDIMLHQLGISSYFTNLGEATQKALESNQYVLSRLQDVLSRLQGSVLNPTAEKINMVPETGQVPEGLQQIKNNLQQQADAEEQQKKLREEKENAKLQNSGLPAAQPGSPETQTPASIPGPNVANELGQAPTQVANTP